MAALVIDLPRNRYRAPKRKAPPLWTVILYTLACLLVEVYEVCDGLLDVASAVIFAAGVITSRWYLIRLEFEYYATG